MSVCVVNTSLRSVSLLIMQAAMGFKKTKITLQRSNIVAMFKATDLNVCIDIIINVCVCAYVWQGCVCLYVLTCVHITCRPYSNVYSR